MPTTIITDSGSDISRSEGQRLGIEIIPVWIIFGEERFKDGIDIDRETFFARMKAESIRAPNRPRPSNSARRLRRS